MRLADASDWSSRRPAWLLTALFLVPTLLGAVIFSYGIGDLPFWRDEVWSVSIAERSLGETLAVLWNREANMGLYYVVLNGWQELGSGEGFTRSLSAVFAVAAIPVTMLFARREFGMVAAVIAGLALASNAFLAGFAQEARAYALVVLLAPLVFWLFVRAVDLQRPRDWVLYVVVAAVMVYTQMLSGLLVVAQFASLPLLAPTPIQRRQAIRGLIGLGALCMPLAAFAVFRDKNQAGWIPDTTLDQIRSIPKEATGSYPLELIYGVLLVIAAVQVVRSIRDSGRGREVWVRGLLLLWVVVPPILLILMSVVMPLVRTPYLIGIVPGLTVLAGATIASLPRTRIAVALSLLMAIFAVANVATRDKPLPKSEDLRAGAAVVAQRGQPTDGVAYKPVWSRVGFSYYLERLAGRGDAPFYDVSLDKTPVEQGDVLAGEAPAATVRKRIESRSRVWLVGYRGFGSRDDWRPGPDPVSRVAPPLLRRDFVRVRTWRFGQINVSLFRNRSDRG